MQNVAFRYYVVQLFVSWGICTGRYKKYQKQIYVMNMKNLANTLCK